MLLYVLWLLLVSVVVHEVGHYIPALLFNANPSYRFEHGRIMMRSYPSTQTQKVIITFTGVFAGFIPLIYTYNDIAWYWSLLLFLSMIAGSHIDLRNLYKNISVYILSKQDVIYSEAKING